MSNSGLDIAFHQYPPGVNEHSADTLYAHSVPCCYLPWVRTTMFWIKLLAYKLALGGALGGEWKKEGELAITSLEFEYLIEKVDAKCWLVEMTSVMMSLPLACVFQCLFTFVLVSTSGWLVKIWEPVDWEPQGDWRWKLNSRDVVASSTFFSHLAIRVTWRACSQAMKLLVPVPCGTFLSQWLYDLVLLSMFYNFILGIFFELFAVVVL